MTWIRKKQRNGYFLLIIEGPKTVLVCQRITHYLKRLRYSLRHIKLTQCAWWIRNEYARALIYFLFPRYIFVYFLLFSKYYYKLALTRGVLFYTKLYSLFLNVPHAASLNRIYILVDCERKINSSYLDYFHSNIFIQNSNVTRNATSFRDTFDNAYWRPFPIHQWAF